MTKIVHQTDYEGWYVGETVADESPLEPGVYLMPAGAYEDAPPARESWPEGQMPRRQAGQWIMQSIPAVSAATPAEKLAAFLAAHPDVAALINNQGGV